MKTVSSGNSSRSEDAGQEAERVLGLDDRVPDNTSAEGKPAKVKGKRVKKKSMHSVSHFNSGS